MNRKEIMAAITGAVEEQDIISYKVYALNGNDFVSIGAILQERPYTAIELIVWMKEKQYHANGFSKVCYPDQWDAKHGKQLALRRAAASIAKQILSEDQ